MSVLMIVKLALQGLVTALDVALPILPEGELKSILTEIDQLIKGALNGGVLQSELKKEQTFLAKQYKAEDKQEG